MKTYPVQVLFREYFEGILAAIFLALFLRFFVVSVLYVPTSNMEPGLQRGDFLIGWRLAYGFPLPLMKGERLRFREPERGDLISLRFPGDGEQLLIRRVIGQEGDKVAMFSGQLVVNGQQSVRRQSADGRLLEQLPGSKRIYAVIESSEEDFDSIEVPAGHVFVMNDNRPRGDDSRRWGVVPHQNIESRLGLIWLPIRHQESGLSIAWNRLFSWVQ